MQKGYTLQALTQEHDYKEMTYNPRLYPGHAIYQEGRLVAYLWFVVEDRELDMHMIEVIDKEQGHGTAIVHFLFDHFDIDTMCGYVLHENSLRPYYFWMSLGSTMSVEDEDDYWMYVKGDVDVTFILQRHILFGNEPKAVTTV